MKILFFCLSLFLLGAATAHAQAVPNQSTTPSYTLPGSGNLQYIPLEPLGGNASTQRGYASLSDYLGTMFKLLISVGALFAVVMLAVSGVRYMLSESGTDKDKAKTRITSALWGLLLLAAAWLIVYTINPDLLNFRLNPSAGPSSPPNTNTGNPARITVSPSNNRNIYNGPNAYDDLMNFHDGCKGTVRAVGPGTDSSGDYTTYQCK